MKKISISIVLFIYLIFIPASPGYSVQPVSKEKTERVATKKEKRIKKKIEKIKRKWNKKDQPGKEGPSILLAFGVIGILVGIKQFALAQSAGCFLDAIGYVFLGYVFTIPGVVLALVGLVLLAERSGNKKKSKEAVKEKRLDRNSGGW